MTRNPRQTVAEILASRPVRSLSDVTRNASKVGYRSRHADDFDDAPTNVYPARAYTASERAWFRKPLGAIALVVALAIGGSAHAAPHAESKAVASAKSEIATARAHLKAARDAEKVQRKALAAQHKAARKVARVAKLKAALAKAESDALACGPCVADSPDSCLCPPAGGKPW